ncbi:unnamed protein product [Cuscuta epithymum]|uniref:Uncharacterized protein n=1 Tax=Cuscuta epithymum TaxID=186058 RepID=A0AAV0D6K6_9ASTE|nr:unnamed protein product [Cuscuta epithymum]
MDNLADATKKPSWLRKKYGDNLVFDTYDGLEGLDDESGEEVSSVPVGEEDDDGTGSDAEGTDDGFRKRRRLI